MPNKLDHLYQIKQKLGEGASAKVYLAHHLADGKPVALKQMQLAPDIPTSLRHQLETRFLQEGDTLSRLKHAHIPQVYEVGQRQGSPAIVMEYIAGQKLFEYIQTQPSLTDLLLRLSEIADALHHAHCQGIVHRDIKPDNIMVVPQRGAILMDFGVARQAESVSQTSDGTMLGTIAYMAPEQLYNSAKADARSDIYSLGIVMYEVMMGQLPFDGVSPAAMILQIFNQEAKHPLEVQPELHAGLAELMMSCLHKEAAARIQTAKQIAYRLQELACELSHNANLNANLNRTQLIISRPSLPINVLQTLGELEGLRLSKAHQSEQMYLESDGRFKHYGLLLGIQHEIAAGFTGALKIKAQDEDSQQFWFKGVIWLNQGRLMHAQLIRESSTPHQDLSILIQTATGQLQKSPQTPSPADSFAEKNTLNLLHDLAQACGIYLAHAQNQQNLPGPAGQDSLLKLMSNHLLDSQISHRVAALA